MLDLEILLRLILLHPHWYVHPVCDGSGSVGVKMLAWDDCTLLHA